MPENLQVPPDLLAKIDQVKAMNRDLLQTFVDLAVEGFENEYNTTTIFGVVGKNIEQILDVAGFDRSQIIVILTTAIIEMAKVQHEGGC